MSDSLRIQIVDSHTGGEPTRVVLSGAPDLGSASLSERVTLFRERYDTFRSAVVNEPRGSDVMVGALLVEPTDPQCAVGVIFFNNVGYLGMCGHGTIGLVVTLAHLGRLSAGVHQIETPVGVVTATLHEDGQVSVRNIPAKRYRKQVPIEIAGHGTVTGDIAWGGNWFYLVQDHGQNLTLENVEALTEFCWRVREALEAQGVTGENGQEIDHIELFAPSPNPNAESRNFVLCPGKAYDRSPCGTGTSAKLACLFEDGKLQQGAVWRQESITGSVFEGSIEEREGVLIPTIRGSAFVNAEATLILNPADPLCFGIREAN